jgi:RNA polymerase sigma-70 factor (ECF subfamily)
VRSRDRFVPDDAILFAVRSLRDGSDAEASARALDAALRPGLLRYFREPPFTPEDAEDLVQRTLALVFQNVGRLRDEERFLGWLYAIARNVKVTERSRRRAEARVVVGAWDAGQTAEPAGRGASDAELERKERMAGLQEAVEGLAPRQRQCLLLRVRDELSYEEIARALALNVLTVRNHIAAARRALRGAAGGAGEEVDR